jgi:hypothetical protein
VGVRTPGRGHSDRCRPARPWAIVFVITALVYIGIRESKTASNIMVALKLAVILLVIGLGAFLRQNRELEPVPAARFLAA